MNYEHYYDRRNDSYVIHFPNFDGISEDELKKMFSVYGPATIKGSGGQFGLYFVRYKNLEDTINCLNGFKGHKSIKILPHKRKVNNKSENKNDSNNKRNPGKTGLINLSNSEETIQKQSGYDNVVSKIDSDCDTSIGSTSSLPQQLKMLQMNKRRSEISISSEIADQTTKTMESTFNEDEIPSLVYRNKKTIVPAQEVIIANIDPSVELKEILTLFKDYHPIATTFIKQVPDSGIRYIHAYFTTVSDALAIEKKFDKYLLREHILIVLRPEMLAKEAFYM
ncbi:uncharacterized protein LOC143355572 [Halictus rubicundus]|uniref:uncharacterized protein LOC143355572 n=1 Tax=Halictus rubicundus TaxID=77578 RepID=UPI0040369F3E